MTCRFCSQWNPDGAVRCAFCRNPPDGESDLTRAGKAALSQDQIDRISHIGETMKPRHASAYPVEDAIRQWFDWLGSHGALGSLVVVAGVLALFLLLANC